jgi:hypothetical protein
MLRAAAENLIVRRDTHLDQLTDKLREERVRRVIQPMLGGYTPGSILEDDIQYVVDLGLIRLVQPGRRIEVANAIYKEILPRALNVAMQSTIPELRPIWLTPAGRLDMAQLLAAFMAFWRQHGEPLMRTTDYPEIAPHLVLLAFLQRVTNSQGIIEREYAIGSGRMDLCVRYAGETFGLELKVWRDGEKDPVMEGLEQLEKYLAGLSLEKGWLVIFNRRSSQPPLAERTTAELAATPVGRQVTVVRA